MYNIHSPNNTFQTASQHKKVSTHHMKTTISRAAGPTLYTLEPHPIIKIIEQFTPLLAENTEHRVQPALTVIRS